MGDFNSIPESLPMRIVRDHSGLIDAWETVHGKRASATKQTDPKSAVSSLGVTADSPINTYSSGKNLDYIARLGLGKRLDCIFYRGPIGRPDRFKLHCVQANVVFTETIPDGNVSYSDHFGVEATIDISNSEGVLDESTESSISDETSLLLTRALVESYRQSSSRSRLELTIFVSCLILLLALCVGSAWVPSRYNPISILITVLLSWLGTTMLYSGFIYGNWERRTLTSVTEELELTRHSSMQSVSTVVGVMNEE